MFLSSIFTGPRILLLGAILLAMHPPVFLSALPKEEGLRISLGLFLFYLIRGIVMPFSNFLLLLEVPLFVIATLTSLLLVPDALVPGWHSVLLIFAPLSILLEGIAVIEIILDLNMLLGERLYDFSSALKATLLFACAAVYGGTLWAVAFLLQLHYMNGSLDATSAGAVAVLLTLLLIFTSLTLFSAHASIFDCVLLALYLGYDIAWISLEWKSPLAGLLNRQSSLSEFLETTIWLGTPLGSLRSMLKTIFSNAMPPHLFVHLLVQLILFSTAISLYERCNQDDEEESKISILWKRFGKALLVLFYTSAWLYYSRRTDLEIRVNWGRWMNAGLVLALYARYLAIGE